MCKLQTLRSGISTRPRFVRSFLSGVQLVLVLVLGWWDRTTRRSFSRTTAQIQLIIVPPPGVASFMVVASPDTTIKHLMLDIAKRTSIPVEQQVLTNGGASLPKTSTIRELRLDDGAQLSVSFAEYLQFILSDH
jgi:hypothetical protein